MLRIFQLKNFVQFIRMMIILTEIGEADSVKQFKK